MVYRQDLADRAQAWISQPLNEKRSGPGLDELARIWAAIQGLPPPSCMRQCQYSERSASVAAYLREFSHFQNPESMSDTQYQFAPAFAGQSVVDENYNKTVTADNLTDEDAEYFIKLGRTDLFIRKDGKAAATPKGEQSETDTRDYAGELATEQDAHKATTGKLEKEQQAHSKASEALKAEKDAHKATKSENSELQKQVKDLQKQLDKAKSAPTAAAPASTEPAAPEAPAAE